MQFLNFLFTPGMIDSIKFLYSGALAKPLVNNIETGFINIGQDICLNPWQEYFGRKQGRIKTIETI